MPLADELINEGTAKALTKAIEDAAPGHQLSALKGASGACRSAATSPSPRPSAMTAPKVFKLAARTLAPGERVTVTKQHSLRPITTRRYYPGAHAVDIRVNGIASTRAEFELLPD